jgi:hypothetical protein
MWLAISMICMIVIAYLLGRMDVKEEIKRKKDGK